jgi:hypothetical protein
MSDEILRCCCCGQGSLSVLSRVSRSLEVCVSYYFFYLRTSYPRPPLRVQKVTQLGVLITICISKLCMVSAISLSYSEDNHGFYLNCHFFIDHWTRALLVCSLFEKNRMVHLPIRVLSPFYEGFHKEEHSGQAC